MQNINNNKKNIMRFHNTTVTYVISIILNLLHIIQCE